MKAINNIVLSAMVIAFLTINLETFAQVGIGTITPNASSMLDVTSSTKGMLAPRMTTAQKLAIVTPASGLLVYDTDLGKFCYYNSSSWIALEANTGRDNYVLVKTLADFPTPASGVITLVAGTMYEINGAIALGSNSIDINGAMITGQDVNNDKLVYTGASSLFTGSNGGLVEFLSLVGNAGSTLFALSDGSKSKNFIFRDNYVLSFGSIGTISGHYMVFFDTVGYLGNANGITYSDNYHLFVNYVLWFDSNQGTYAKLTGTFHLVSFLGGEVSAGTGETGIDVTGITSITDTGVLKLVAFIGSGTRKNGNFSKEWEIISAGLNQETDVVATGNLNVSASAATTGLVLNTPKKVAGTTTGGYFFRVDEDSPKVNNRLRYMGTKTRYFRIAGRASVKANSNGQNISVYIAKNGTVIAATRSRLRLPNSGIEEDVGFVGSVELAPTDYIEIWVENNSGTAEITFSFMNLILF